MDYPNFSFEITKTDKNSRARRGTLTTPHGAIQTPNYIFCGTKASVKAMHPSQLKDAKTDIILANTYHLMLQPGEDLIDNMGGLHKFMKWDGPMLTDSGGFQMFSLGHASSSTNEIKGSNRPDRNKSLLKITEEGAKFKSHIDGTEYLMTPESAMEIQRKLGADLIMQFDECPAYYMNKKYLLESFHRSHRWGDRCLKQFEKTHTGKQGLYGIVQGSTFEDLRIESSKYSASRPYFGTAIGGVLGDTKQSLSEVVSWCAPHIHPERPVHLLGIGLIEDVFSCVRHGMDTFDCVSPTRIARHGIALQKGVKGNKINIKNAKFRTDETPLDGNLGIEASDLYSKAYIHHLFKANELLALQILTQHNIATINKLMREVRQALDEDCLDELEKEWLV